MTTVREFREQLGLVPDQDREIKCKGQPPVLLGNDAPYVNIVPGPYSTDDPEDVAEPHDAP
jgi:hypothetical protein